MKNKLLTLSVILIIPVVLLLIAIPFSSAVEEFLCVTAEVTDISPTSIKIGDEFTVGILIDNCGSEIPKNIVFELIDVSPFLGVKESLKNEIGKIGYSNSNRFILYHMKVAENAVPGEYVFDYRLTYGSESFSIQREGNFSVTIIGDESELSIASLKTDPVLPIEGDTVELTLRIENAGKGAAKSVRIYVNHSFQGLKQSFIGTLESDEDGPAVLTFIVDKPGEYTFPVTISYNDDLGDNEIKTDVNISVLEKSSNIWGIILSIALIALIGVGVYYFIRTKRAKDEIIHQLLKGNESKDKKKK